MYSYVSIIFETEMDNLGNHFSENNINFKIRLKHKLKIVNILNMKYKNV